jgi:hypothetical protein
LGEGITCLRIADFKTGGNDNWQRNDTMGLLS